MVAVAVHNIISPTKVLIEFWVALNGGNVAAGGDVYVEAVEKLK